MQSLQQQQQRADTLAPWMFGLAAVFLILLASLIVLWVDIPRVRELAESVVVKDQTANSVVDATRLTAMQDPQYMQTSARMGSMVGAMLLALWPLFWLEYLYSLRLQNNGSRFSANGLYRFIACFIPPCRLSTPSSAWGERIWLPILHWQTPGKALVRTLERLFSKPMLVIALLILPILLIEFGLKSLVEEHEWLRLLLHVCTGFIWCAFAFEFIVLISATDKKLVYVKKHWIDLAIILLPLISFLRTVRVLRLARLAKVQKLAKMGRVFRMRGLLMKTLRALMFLEVVNRLLRVTPEKKLVKLKAEYTDRLEDLEELKATIEQLESAVADELPS